MSLTQPTTDLSEDEAWARNCISEAFPGCKADQHDDSSEPGMYNYNLTVAYPDGRIGTRCILECLNSSGRLVEVNFVRQRERPWRVYAEYPPVHFINLLRDA